MANIQAGDHWVWWGDGEMARILDSKELYKKGLKMTRFLLKPSADLENRYDIKDKQDPDSGVIVKEYPSLDVIWLVRGIAKSRCWVVTDFLGGPTNASMRDHEFRQSIKDSQRLVASAETAKARAYQELEKERSQQLQALRSKVDHVKMARRAAGKVDLSDDDAAGYLGDD